MSHSPVPDKLGKASHLPGQPVLFDVPNVGPVPLTLTEPHNKCTLKAKNAREKEYKVNTRWIVPSFFKPY